jgi:hypothetical protein
MTTTAPAIQSSLTSSQGTRERYMLVSVDSHVGPSPAKHLREYCEAKYLDAFDEDVRRTTAHIESNQSRDLDNEDPLGAKNQGGQTVAATMGISRDHNQAMIDRWAAASSTAGLQDPYARLKDMDQQGVAADIIFAGGQNNELLPFDTRPRAAGRRSGDLQSLDGRLLLRRSGAAARRGPAVDARHSGSDPLRREGQGTGLLEHQLPGAPPGPAALQRGCLRAVLVGV